jgi:predicted dehydrogenase
MSIRLAVVGCGRMGKLHARVLHGMDDVELACVVDINPAAASALARHYRCLGLTDAAAAVDSVDGAIIATPTLSHVEAARPFVAAGKHVLIEKPYTHDPAAGAALVELADRSRAGVQVGHTERFNPVVLAMRTHAIAPKFIEAHRISPFTFRSADVGVVLDMMIHDLDLVRMMVHGAVRQVQAVGVNVIGAHEDIANARLTFDNGCVATLTASRLAIKTERKMRVFSEQAYLSVDYGKKTGIVVTKSANLDLIQMARDRDASDLAELAAKLDYVRHLKVEHLKVDESAEPLRRQAEAFRDTVAHGAPPVVSARDGLAAVQLAADIVAAIKRHRWDGEASPREGLGVITKDG